MEVLSILDSGDETGELITTGEIVNNSDKNKLINKTVPTGILISYWIFVLARQIQFSFPAPLLIYGDPIIMSIKYRNTTK